MLNYTHRSSLLSAYSPDLIALSDNLTAAAFPLMKVYPAYHCMQRAMEEKTINSSTVVLESSSGTMALGLAIVCKWTGHHLIVVSDYACDPLVQMRLRDLGATVKIVTAPAAVGGYQRARLDLLHSLSNENKNSWWVNQYDNPSNAESYSMLASQLIESLGRIDCIVGTVGSGGSMCGTTRYLRLLYPDLIAIGVDTFGSVLFGQPDGPRILRGLGNSIYPANLDHTVFDEIHWVSAAEAYSATRLLHRRTGLFRGGTSGAAWFVARHWAEQHPALRTVCLLPDDGHRYVDTIYNEKYMHDNHLWLESLPEEPRKVHTPASAISTWSYIEWGRRAYAKVACEKGRVTSPAIARGSLQVQPMASKLSAG
jgi:cysteine synthase